MFRYVVRKAVGWLVMIIVATNATYFLASWFLDPRSNYRDLRPVRTDEQISNALAPYGLDPRTSVLSRWWHWLTDVVTRFDWGHSPTGVPVNSELPHRILVSGQLILVGVVLSVVLGVALGVYTASRQYGAVDRVTQTLSVVLYNVPTVVSALGLVLVAISLNQHLGFTFLHVAGANTAGGVDGFWPNVLDRLNHLILPTVNLTLTGYVSWHLTQRALLLDALNADYVRTARATGLTRAQAIRRHALRASLIPTATSIAFTIPAVLTGAIITETVFGWEGMGRYFIQTINKNDVHGAVAVAAFGAVMTAIGAILADIATVALDPRVRVS
ncbi:ABC transporter permease [Labedaea rhizosphaerae]|uniref:Peptide/nickel transport system permease protein n=1 Tax=Labedaea rhizosphaerae TaxID=598644 RepID=A0A4R6SH59_LABRH|nr:ABC transporter permease [Labedaea rhizosphaerae]TDQ00258.1 peptide/nickel transport system permease protein [Labedaea rhizosphaerae]